MKKIILILSAICLMTSCYEDYVRDYDYTMGYIAYQYDLRTFVVGENESFKVSVAMAGVVDNHKDRVFSVVEDKNLCTGDLSGFSSDGSAASFTANDALKGSAPFGTLAGGASSYVSAAFKAAKLAEITPLPDSYYSVDFSTMTIPAEDVNAFATVTAQPALFSDPNAWGPYYAIGYKIVSADVDSLYKEKSFAIVGIRCENKFFGNWYHGGKSTVDGAEVKYPFSIPQEDTKVYTLTSVDANTVLTDKYVQNAGHLRLTFNGDDITITSDDVPLVPDSRRSYFNGAKLLQDRVLYLNYSYKDSKDRVVAVSDSLVFRNRIRDGINEWQDTDPTHYQN